jgi:hypothetical protein
MMICREDGFSELCYYFSAGVNVLFLEDINEQYTINEDKVPQIQHMKKCEEDKKVSRKQMQLFKSDLSLIFIIKESNLKGYSLTNAQLDYDVTNKNLTKLHEWIYEV